MAEENEHQVKLTADITGLKKALKEAQKELDKVDEKADKANTTAKKFTGTITNWSDEPRTAFQQMLDITEDYYHELEKASDAIQQYKKQASSAGADTDKLSNNVSNASAKIAESYRKMTDSLAAIGGKDWDTNVEFKGLKGDVQNVEEEFKNVENEYKTLLDELETGGNAQNTAQALTDVKDKAEEVSESFVDAGQESAEGLGAIAEEADVIENAYSDAGQNVAQDFSSMEQSAEQAGDAFSDVCDEVETESKGMSFSSIGDAIAGAFERVRSITDDFLGSLKMDATDPTQEMAQDVDQFGRSLEGATQQAEMFEDAWNQATWPTEEMAEEASELERHIDDVNAEMERLKTQETPTQEFIDLQNQISKAEQQLEKYYNRQEKYESTGVKQDSRSWVSLQYDIQTTENQLDHLQTAMDNLKDAGHDVEINPDDKQLEKLQKDLDKSNEQLKKMQDEADKAAKSVDSIGTASSSSSGGLGSMVSSLSSVISPILGIIVSLGSAIMNGLKTVINAGINLIKSALSALVSLVTNIAKSIWNALKKVVSTATDVAKNIAEIASKPVLNGIKSLAKFIGQAGLGLVGFNSDAEKSVDVVKQLTNAWTSLCNQLKSQVVRSAAKAILSDVEEVMVAIAGVSDEFNETMSGLIDSAKALGAQIVAIIEPIVDAVGPYLIQIMDWLTGVADTAAQFVARITGNDTYVKAEKGQSDYASSLDDTTKSTQKATKATKEFQNTVLAFDQLNKLDDVSSTVSDEDEDSLLGISDADVKKAQTQATAVNDIADDIYKAFENKDWYEVGKNAAKAINEIFEALDEWLGWDYNADRFTEWMQGIIDCVHGFIEGLDWQKIGTEIGDILNSVIYLFGQITDPVNGINFRQIGRDLGTLLEAAIDKIDWEQLGKDIIQGMQAAVNFVVGLLEGDIGGKLGAKLAEGISGMASAIDSDVWADLIIQLFTNFFDFFIELFSNPEDFATIGYKIGAGIAEAINGIDMNKVETAVNNAFASLTALFNNFISGLEENLNLEEGETIWTKLGSWFMEGIQWVMSWLTKNLLNGETGAKVGAAISDIFAGIVDSFDSDTWADFFNGIGEFIGNMLIEVFGDTEKFKEAGAKIADTLIKILNGSEDDTEEDAESGSLGEGIKAVWDALVAVLAGAIGEDGENVETIVQAIKTMFDNIWKALNSEEFQKEIDELAKIVDAIVKGAFGETDNDEDTMTFLAHKLAELFGKALDFFWDAYAPEWLKALVGFFEDTADAVDDAAMDQAYTRELQEAAEWDALHGYKGTEAESHTQQTKERWKKIKEETIDEADKDAKEVAEDIKEDTDETADAVGDGLDKMSGRYADGAEDIKQEVDRQMLHQKLEEDAKSTKDAAAEYEEANQELGKSLDNISKTTKSKTEITADFLMMHSLGSAVSEDAESVKNASAEYDSAIDSTVSTIDNGANAVDESSDMVFGILDEDTNTFMTDDSLAKAAYEYFEAIADVMIDGFDNVITITADGWGQITTTIADGASSFLNNTTADTAIEEFFGRLNRMIEVMFEQTMREVSSGISGINLKLENVGVGIAMVPKLASGGRLDDGQLFIANEHGPELIGTYGNATGVMNNEQIVQAVTEGVRTAVTEAWNNSNQDSGDIVLYIDSEEIARASTKGNRSIQKRTNPVVSFA